MHGLFKRNRHRQQVGDSINSACEWTMEMVNELYPSLKLIMPFAAAKVVDAQNVTVDPMETTSTTGNSHHTDESNMSVSTKVICGVLGAGFVVILGCASWRYIKKYHTHHSG